jgi:prepilin-type N-terminal cleavage/methylation domain-containing protein
MDFNKRGFTPRLSKAGWLRHQEDGAKPPQPAQTGRLVSSRKFGVTARGFTLIELMVALAILGLIATLLASGTRLGLDISARGNAKAEAIRMEQLGRILVRSQLMGVLPYHYWTHEENKRVEHVAFEGEADRIRFVSRYGLLDGPGSLPRWVELRWEKPLNSEAKLIVEEHRILSPDNQPGETTTARAEILNCSDLRFEYLDIVEEKHQWFSTWDVTERKAPLPLAIRVQCKTAEDPARSLIPLDYAESARQGMSLQ